MWSGTVCAVAKDGTHRFSKERVAEIRIIAGLGVEGDAHSGETVKHRSRVAVDPSQPNLRQVHLIQSELLAEVGKTGLQVRPGDLGENITTSGIDLLALPKGTLLKIGETAVLEVTGLRNPCKQIEDFQPGLLAAVLARAENGDLIRKSGIMTIAKAGGIVRAGDTIQATCPAEPHLPLAPV